MKIILAGMNIDQTVLMADRLLLETIETSLNPDCSANVTGLSPEEIRVACREALDAGNRTPETISAAYARISRDPRPVDILRTEACHWVGKARRSNRNIIFGMGHASVAEHAVFNIDIIGVSRLLAELIQHHRLCSFTEKSQRYIRLGEDFIIPEEVRLAGISDAFESFVRRQFQRYETALQELQSGGRPLETAGEDARYLLPMSVTTQMGMTANARNIEYMLQTAASSGIMEHREFGRNLFRVIDGIAPSLIKYTAARTETVDRDKRLRDCLTVPGSRKGKLPEAESPEAADPGAPVKLQYVTPHADQRVMEAVRFRLTGENGFGDPSSPSIPDGVMEHTFREMFRGLEPWDAVPREFECAEAQFVLVISAAAFAQLKRHRMATLIAAPYHPKWAYTTPPSFADCGLEDILDASAKESEVLFHRIWPIAPEAAPYALLGAHRRRVLIKINARELIHLSRLREDVHAQWDIREIAGRMIQLAREEMPFCMMLAAGKHAFEEHYRQIFKTD